jgi:hypothetical protein
MPRVVTWEHKGRRSPAEGFTNELYGTVDLEGSDLGWQVH